MDVGFQVGLGLFQAGKTTPTGWLEAGHNLLHFSWKIEGYVICNVLEPILTVFKSKMRVGEEWNEFHIYSKPLSGFQIPYSSVVKILPGFITMPDLQNSCQDLVHNGR